MLGGHWLKDTASSQVVISEELQKEENLSVGDTVELGFDKDKEKFQVIGVVKIFETKAICIQQALLNKYLPKEACIHSIKCVTRASGISKQAFFRDLGKEIDQAELLPMGGETKAEIASILFNHYSVTLNSFLVVSILLIFVAGFGLAASMNIQTEERNWYYESYWCQEKANHENSYF